jgi:hypothetical protein
VADQAFKPDLEVDSLAIPLDDDVLVPVADEAEPAVIGNPLAATFPTPAEVIVGEQVLGSPSQDFAEVPGVPPLFLPFPPSKAAPNIQGQSVTAGNPAEFTVAGSDISIQINQTPATVENYTITAVLDADTGGPPPTGAPSSWRHRADDGRERRGQRIRRCRGEVSPRAPGRGEAVQVASRRSDADDVGLDVVATEGDSDCIDSVLHRGVSDIAGCPRVAIGLSISGEENVVGQAIVHSPIIVDRRLDGGGGRSLVCWGGAGNGGLDLSSGIWPN